MPLIPPIILDLSPAPPSSLFSLDSPLGSFLFSYTVSALFLGVGALIGWAYKVPHDQQVASVEQIDNSSDVGRIFNPSEEKQVPLGKRNLPPVARIIGMADCRWADPRTAPIGFDRVPLGRKYALASGLMEIVYDTGARVILQGPCVYEVESETGGYLSLGKLTARVEKKNEVVSGQWSVVSEANPSSLIPHPSSLFSVRTPTAVVTDLGTEFGIEVDKSGATKSHVFRGKIELRLAGGAALPSPSGRGAGGEGGVRVIVLGENESATVEVGQGRAIKVVRDSRQSKPPPFARQMPKRVRIETFNTGVGLTKVGQPDPHWQIVARTDDPKFKPRQAVATCAVSEWMANDFRSQWISLTADSWSAVNVTYKFRTTFELVGVLPRTAVLRGQMAADDAVRAIYLNGRKVFSARNIGKGAGFIAMLPFFVTDGFVEGANVLEFDVANFSLPTMPDAPTPMGFRVELEGFATVSPYSDGAAVQLPRQPRGVTRGREGASMN